MKELTPKTALLSTLYLLLVVLFAFLLNLGLGWVIDEAVIPIINWFNEKALVWKFVLFIFGGYTIFFIILNVIKLLTGWIFILVFFRLPENNFTVISSGIVYIVNLGLLVYGLWEITPPLSFWIVLEFALIAFFIASATSVLMPWYLKAKLTRDQRNNY